jgi:hypothetical protein
MDGQAPAAVFARDIYHIPTRRFSLGWVHNHGRGRHAKNWDFASRPSNKTEVTMMLMAVQNQLRSGLRDDLAQCGLVAERFAGFGWAIFGWMVQHNNAEDVLVFQV